ncbi:hypothetical protein F4802DRAFT_82602 [Xylaria palmicola]|nr:hypothetical protein F4802DRAFT_82602 [Xylaria palmicola]
MRYPSATMLPIILASILASLTQALPTAVDARASVSNQALADAQNQWRADTSRVSQFLSAAPTLSGEGLATAAAAALASEQDELTHKAVLDGALLATDARVRAADDVLVAQGTFQSVVDALQQLTDSGAAMSPADVAALVARTNTVRCGRVLPAIDTYFRVTGEKLNNGGFLVATRPNNC